MKKKPKRQPKVRTLKYRLKPSDTSEIQMFSGLIDESLQKAYSALADIEACALSIDQIRRRFEGK